MTQRKKIKVAATEKLQYSENLDAFISMLQKTRTTINRHGWTNPRVVIDVNEGDWEYAYVQVIAERDETDSEFHVRQLVEKSAQESREYKERQLLAELQEKYRNV